MSCPTRKTSVDARACENHRNTGTKPDLPLVEATDTCRPNKLNSYCLIKILIVVGSIMTILVGWTNREEILHIYGTLCSIPLGRICISVGQCILMINCLAFLYHLVLAVRYRRTTPCDDNQLPLCTVVVPAYNEGRQVWHTLLSIVSSDYPRDKLQIIAVDDGSEDDTWSWISKAAEAGNGLIQTVRLPSNQGKRHALYQGQRHDHRKTSPSQTRKPVLWGFANRSCGWQCQGAKSKRGPHSTYA